MSVRQARLWFQLRRGRDRRGNYKNGDDGLHKNTDENKQKTIDCVLCGSVFLNTHFYNQHLQVHQKQTQPKYRCNQCGRGFLSPVLLDTHGFTHPRGNRSKRSGSNESKTDLPGPSMSSSISTENVTVKNEPGEEICDRTDEENDDDEERLVIVENPDDPRNGEGTRPLSDVTRDNKDKIIDVPLDDQSKSDVDDDYDEDETPLTIVSAHTVPWHLDCKN